MAIKFSQFVVETNKANVNYLVGWDGAENVQITPADLLGSYPSGSGATGQVAFFDSASSIGGDNDLFFDSANKRLGIGTTTPTEKLEIVGNIRIDSTSAAQLFLDSAAGNDSVINFQEGASQKAKMGYDNSLTGLAIVAGSGPYSTADMVILSGGNVGIGTTSPSAKLEVDGTLISTGISQLGSGGANVYLPSSSAGNVGIGTSSPNAKLQVGGDLHVYDEEGNTDARVMLSTGTSNVTTVKIASNGSSFFNAGNIGIGTTSPDSTLEVENTPAQGSQTRMLHLDNNPVGNEGSGYLQITSGTNTQAALQIEQVSSGGSGFFGNNYLDSTFINRGVSANAYGNINFATGSSTSTTSIVMTIGGGSQKGNVGIGTTSPTHLLTLEAASSPGIKIKDTTQGATLLAFSQDSDSHLGTYSAHPLVLDTNSTERMRITSAGNVGIGTTSPTTKFQVAGNSTYISVKNTSNNRAVDLGADSSGDGQIIMRDSSNNNKILFYAEAGSANYINNGGNFGIGTTSPASKLEVDGGDIEIDDSASGLILKSPDGTRYRVTVANGGTLSVAAV